MLRLAPTTLTITIAEVKSFELHQRFKNYLAHGLSFEQQVSNHDRILGTFLAEPHHDKVSINIETEPNWTTHHEQGDDGNGSTDANSEPGDTFLPGIASSPLEPADYGANPSHLDATGTPISQIRYVRSPTPGSAPTITTPRKLIRSPRVLAVDRMVSGMTLEETIIEGRTRQRSLSAPSLPELEPRDTSRHLRVYNDAMPAAWQPRTPLHLPEARHQSRIQTLHEAGSITQPRASSNQARSTRTTRQQSPAVRRPRWY